MWTEAMEGWLARHQDGNYLDALNAELVVLAKAPGAESFVDAGVAAAEARTRGALLVPALRTSESVVLYALGATGLDPLRSRFRAPWLGCKDWSAQPLWYAGDERADVPTAPCWQIAAADLLWPDERPWSLDDFTPSDAELVLFTGTLSGTEGRNRTLPAPPRTFCDLAALCALSSPLGEEAGLPALFVGTRTDLQPSVYPSFADSRGWPVFQEDVAAWLVAEAECSVDDAWLGVRALRIPGTSPPRSAVIECLTAIDPLVAGLLDRFGPRMMPRSVAWAEASLAVVGARALDADRRLADAVRKAFREEEP
jgi:hypothetical protein